MAPQSSESKPMYQKDEKALCFHGELLYEAKVLDVRRSDPKDKTSPHEYRVHYKGWKNTWDDWVPQDRLRKLTDDNRELAANLRRELTAVAPKIVPKSIGKTRRGQGSEIDSGRGSEERTSSVPATGRGSKRARDNDIEKVGETHAPKHVRFSLNAANLHAHTLALSNSCDPIRTRGPGPFGSPLGNPLGPSLGIPVGNSLGNSFGTPTGNSLGRTLDSLGKPTGPNSDTAAVTSNVSSTLEEPDFDKGPNQVAAASQNGNSHSYRVTEANEELDLRNFVHVPRQAALQANKSILTKPKSSAAPPSARAKTPLSKKHCSAKPQVGTTRQSRRLKSVQGVDHDEDLEVLESEDDVLSTLQQSAVDPTANPSTKPIKTKPSRKTAPPKLSTSPSAAVATSARKPPTARSTTTRSLRSASKTMAPARRKPFVPPWHLKDTKQYTSQEIDEILARPPPPDEPEYFSNETFRENRGMFFAPLLSGTTINEKNAIDQEIEAARRSKTRYRPMFLGTRQEDSENPNLVDVSNADEEPRKLIPTAGVAKDPFVIDPPGSGTPFDALKFPNRLVQEVNRYNGEILKVWGEDAQMLIPNGLVIQFHPDILASMSYNVLKDRPDFVIAHIPEDSRFWQKYYAAQDKLQKEAAKAKPKPQAKDAEEGLLTLSSPASTSSSNLDQCANCIAVGVRCNGAKPSCHWCEHEGLQCSFNLASKGKERAIRDDVDLAEPQHRHEYLDYDHFTPMLRSRVPPTREVSGLDILALAAEIYEQNSADQVQASLASLHNQEHNQEHNQDCYQERHQDRQPAVSSDYGVMNAHISFPDQVETFEIAHRIAAYKYLTAQEENYYSRPSIRISVPDHLKNLLVDDWENVTKSLLLVPLPSQAPANYILDEYFTEEKLNRRLGSVEADILEEFVAGLKTYFEKSVGKILLYRFERSQLAEVRKLWESGKYKEWEGKGPGDCYGAEHLTRMIVNLPEIIAQTNMDAESVARLKAELSKFSTWLSRNSGRFFCAKYEKPSAEYIENAR